MSQAGGNQMRAEVRWGLGCLVGAAALSGMVILVLLVAYALQPPTWVQIVLGVGLVAGGGLLTWLVGSALGQSRARDEQGPRSVPSAEDES
jgi:hypothetical protein